MAHDALGAHARDELGLSDTLGARPLQAAFASAATFVAGAALPILTIMLASRDSLSVSVSGASLICLAALGALAAARGGVAALLVFLVLRTLELVVKRGTLGDVLHWAGRYQNWNMMCAECHTTDFKKGYDPAADTYRSSWSELHVGCQACHGPGGDHVAWARKGGRGAASGLVVGFRPGDALYSGAAYEVDACATCHSRRSRIAAGEHPGRQLYDTLRPEPLRAGLYHADGQQLDEVYAYGSFRQSKMYSRGVRCTHCHNPHNGETKAEGNAVCTQCHSQGDAGFVVAGLCSDLPAGLALLDLAARAASRGALSLVAVHVDQIRPLHKPAERRASPTK